MEDCVLNIYLLISSYSTEITFITHDEDDKFEEEKKFVKNELKW